MYTRAAPRSLPRSRATVTLKLLDVPGAVPSSTRSGPAAVIWNTGGGRSSFAMTAVAVVRLPSTPLLTPVSVRRSASLASGTRSPTGNTDTVSRA